MAKEFPSRLKKTPPLVLTTSGVEKESGTKQKPPPTPEGSEIDIRKSTTLASISQSSSIRCSKSYGQVPSLEDLPTKSNKIETPITVKPDQLKTTRFAYGMNKVARSGVFKEIAELNEENLSKIELISRYNQLWDEYEKANEESRKIDQEREALRRNIATAFLQYDFTCELKESLPKNQ